MSYCRWSDNDFQCDLYVYEDVSGGYQIMVAASRYVFAEPLPEPLDFLLIPGFTEEQGNAYLARHAKVMNMVKEASSERIHLPYAGEFFHYDTPGECADQLKYLQEIGYRVPQYAIDALRAEVS